MPDKPLRLRVFAGPNGSGKSTIIQSVKNTPVGNHLLDMGFYINADDIATSLAGDGLSFNTFDLDFNRHSFHFFALNSGLLGPGFTLEHLKQAYRNDSGTIRLNIPAYKDKAAQLIARFLREEMLRLGRKFSFETVFSHISNVDTMCLAAEMGYKVYLYFVATESPEINKLRVVSRKLKGGHDVPAAYIEKRYYRSLNLLYEACEICYQAYFFDNSLNNQDFRLLGGFKVQEGKKMWNLPDRNKLPGWFHKYYTDKML